MAGEDQGKVKSGFLARFSGKAMFGSIPAIPLSAEPI
jgi:hypothetical protein